jgi:Flp pilus assembly pilin Flp
MNEQLERGHAVRDLLRRTSREGPQRGQTMAEYAVVLAVVMIGIVVSITALGTTVSGAIGGIAALVDGVA